MDADRSAAGPYHEGTHWWHGRIDMPLTRTSPPNVHERTTMGRFSLFRIAITWVLLLALPGLAAASSDEEPEPNVDEILAGANERLMETESLYFELDIDGDSFIDEDQTLQLLNAEGQLQRPDEVAVTFQVQALEQATLSIQMITLGEDAWTTDVVTGDWQPAPEEFGYNPAILFDEEVGLSSILEDLPEAEVETIEEVNGNESYKIAGVVPEDDIGPITADTITGGDAEIHIWIDVDDAHILRVEVIESEDAEEGEPATWVMELSQHDEQVTIEPPE